LILVDTNVLLALLVETEHSTPARQLQAGDADWISEPLLMYELTNVLTTLQRVGRLDAVQAQAALGRAQVQIGSRLRAVTDADALATAAHFGISGYDARFIVLARALGTPLVTEDRRLRAVVPDYTRSIAQALAA
jgi:predicted nucleic acid-binding protein